MDLRRLTSSLLGASLLAACWTGSAAAQPRSPAEICQHGEDEARIAACTQVIFTARGDAATLRSAYRFRGMGHAAKGQYDRAVADFTESLKIPPVFASTLLARGSAYLEKEDDDRAIADLSEVIRADPENRGGVGADAYDLRGLAFARKGAVDRAVSDHAAAIRLDGRPVYPHLNRARLLEERRDLAGALADYEAALRLDETNDRARAGKQRVLANLANAAAAPAAPPSAPRPSPPVERTLLGRRLAFVAGANSYPNLPRDAQLERAVADAEAVGDTLARLGFRVTRLTRDVTHEALLRRFGEFTEAIEPGDTALFFFAGHGIALAGTNYLIPSDIPSLNAGNELLLRSRALAETDLIEAIRTKGARITVMVIDACRNNPFPKIGARSVGLAKGLTMKEPAEGVFAIYSAGFGQEALDRLPGKDDGDRNSVFTRVFLQQIRNPNLNLVDLGEVLREEVVAIARSVGHPQVPAVYNQVIGGRRVFLAAP